MKGAMKFRTSSREVFACHDASCRPPTSGGTGGSTARGTVDALYRQATESSGAVKAFVESSGLVERRGTIEGLFKSNTATLAKVSALYHHWAKEKGAPLINPLEGPLMGVNRGGAEISTFGRVLSSVTGVSYGDGVRGVTVHGLVLTKAGKALVKQITDDEKSAENAVATKYR